MEVRLSVTNGKANVKQVVLGNETIIGRSHECNLKIASSQVSRRHCRISVSESEVHVADLGSANGTFLNGRALPPDTDTLVSPGNALTIGPLRFVFHFKPPVAPKVVSQVPESDTKDAIPLALLGRPAPQLGEEETVDSANPQRATASSSPLGSASPAQEAPLPTPAANDDDFEEGLPDRTMSGLKEGAVVVSPPEGAADTVLDMNLAEEAKRKAAQKAVAKDEVEAEVTESHTDSGTALISPEDEKSFATEAGDNTATEEAADFPDFKAADLADEEVEDEEPAKRSRPSSKAGKPKDKGKEKKSWLGGMFGGKAKARRPDRKVDDEDEVEEVVEEFAVESETPPAASSRSKPQPKAADDDMEEIGAPVDFSEPEPELEPAKSSAAAEPEFDPADFLMSLSGKEAAENLDPKTKQPGAKPVTGKPNEKSVAPRLSPLEKPSAKASPSPQVKPQVKSSGSAGKSIDIDEDGSLDDFLKNL